MCVCSSGWKVVCVCLLLCSMYLRCVVLLLFIVEIIFQVLRCAKLCCGRVFLGGGLFVKGKSSGMLLWMFFERLISVVLFMNSSFLLLIMNEVMSLL